MSKTESKTDKLLTAFKSGRILTAKQIASTYSLKNPHEAVRTLRNAGFAIYGNDAKLSDGSVVTKYRLGQPSRKMVAAAAALFGADVFSR